MSDTSHILQRYGLAQVPTKEGNVYLFPVTADELKSVVETLKQTHSLPLKTVSATDERARTGAFRIYYVFGVPKENVFLVPYVSVDKDARTFPSMTPYDQEFSVYEQEIMTFFGLEPVSHPRASRIILHQENYPKDVYPLRKDFAWDTKVEAPAVKEYPTFQKYAGEGVYEIPVGPVHAGIIEPGHFRFSVLGEEILRLEPRLGYVHKGTEKLFEHLPLEKKLVLAERISGDSSYHHALAFSQAIEQLMGLTVPSRGRLLRVVYAELERLANHFNDLAFIMLDTGFSFGGSQGSRLRERIMQWNERLTGSRFLRGVITYGGVTCDIEEALVGALHDDLELLEKDFMEVMAVTKESDSVRNRLKGTGKLDAEVAKDHGAVGIARRACGVEIDARADFPYAGYDMVQFGIMTEKGGDVYARFRVRAREVTQSFRLLNQSLALLLHEPGAVTVATGMLPPDSYAVSVVEGWRGDIVYFITTDSMGNVSRVKVRDPSFLNWTVFPYIIGQDMVPDFPLINKSFNLSYTGNDL
ncbi:MAG: NADH-quinone oxidoreductase subunit C [Candidatus Moranbacteria bacterium]|nr:NADH-quinone oxidoreductase subunit C [Candidatus Moranbacteria bacterium]